MTSLPLPLPLASLVLAGLVACGADAVTPPDAMPLDGPDATPRGQGSETTADLVINEVAPRGDGADWIELHNTSAAPIDLCGYFLTDATDRLDHYLPLGGVRPPATCPSNLLDAGAYLMIAVDDTALPVDHAIAFDPTHTPFSLGVADQVHLLTLAGQVVDGLSYLYPPGPSAPAAGTMARDPDGHGAFFVRTPTPGAGNDGAL